jgi:hypothetical protein
MHTPGPWNIERPLLNDNIAITVDGIVTAECLAVVLTGTRELPEDTANAHLIAAAPELLEALEALLADQETMREPYRNEALCESARAAIAKARGAAEDA